MTPFAQLGHQEKSAGILKLLGKNAPKLGHRGKVLKELKAIQKKHNPGSLKVLADGMKKVPGDLKNAYMSDMKRNGVHPMLPPAIMSGGAAGMAAAPKIADLITKLL